MASWLVRAFWSGGGIVLCSHSSSLHPGVQMGSGERNRGKGGGGGTEGVDNSGAMH